MSFYGEKTKAWVSEARCSWWTGRISRALNGLLGFLGFEFAFLHF